MLPFAVTETTGNQIRGKNLQGILFKHDLFDSLGASCVHQHGLPLDPVNQLNVAAAIHPENLKPLFVMPYTRRYAP